MLYENITFDENTKIYVNLVSVSKSGMTRKAKFYTIVDNELQNITDVMAKALGQNLDKNYCLTIRGCGSDMFFHTLYRFAMGIGFESQKALSLVWVNHYYMI